MPLPSLGRRRNDPSGGSAKQMPMQVIRGVRVQQGNVDVTLSWIAEGKGAIIKVGAAQRTLTEEETRELAKVFRQCVDSWDRKGKGTE